MHFGCVELVEQQGSTRSSRVSTCRIVETWRDEPSGIWAYEWPKKKGCSGLWCAAICTIQSDLNGRFMSVSETVKSRNSATCLGPRVSCRSSRSGRHFVVRPWVKMREKLARLQNARELRLCAHRNPQCTYVQFNRNYISQRNKMWNSIRVAKLSPRCIYTVVQKVSHYQIIEKSY